MNKQKRYFCKACDWLQGWAHQTEFTEVPDSFQGFVAGYVL